jgi:DNA-binding NtrC family response regulator
MGDLKLLATEFLARFSQQNGKKITGFDDAAMDWILSFSWPGNVRELKNAVERAVIMSRGTTIGLDDIVPRHLRITGEVPAVTLSVGSTLADARRQLLLRTFSTTGGDAERTAKMLGIGVGDLRSELAALVSGTGMGGGGGVGTKEGGEIPESGSAAARNVKATAPAKERAAAKAKRGSGGTGRR